MSLWRVSFVSAEARRHLCQVCSEYTDLLLITLYKPMRELSKKCELEACVYFRSSVFMHFLFPDIPLHIKDGCFTQIYFCSLLIFGDTMEIIKLWPIKINAAYATT